MNVRVFLRIEIHPSFLAPDRKAVRGKVITGWRWRLTEPRPGRNAVLRRAGMSRWWWLALVCAGIASYRYRRGVMQ